MQSKRNCLGVVVAIVVIGWWLWPQSNQEPAADTSHLVNRIWMDHLPRDPRERREILVLLDDPIIGAFSSNTAFEGDWAMFEWSNDRGFRLKMLQSEKEYKVTAKITSGRGCKGFDYCLHLKGAPRGARKYGSMEDWIIEGTDAEALQREIMRFRRRAHSR